MEKEELLKLFEDPNWVATSFRDEEGDYAFMLVKDYEKHDKVLSEALIGYAGISFEDVKRIAALTPTELRIAKLTAKHKSLSEEVRSLEQEIAATVTTPTN